MASESKQEQARQVQVDKRRTTCKRVWCFDFLVADGECDGGEVEKERGGAKTRGEEALRTVRASWDEHPLVAAGTESNPCCFNPIQLDSGTAFSQF